MDDGVYEPREATLDFPPSTLPQRSKLSPLRSSRKREAGGIMTVHHVIIDQDTVISTHPRTISRSTLRSARCLCVVRVEFAETADHGIIIRQLLRIIRRGLCPVSREVSDGGGCTVCLNANVHPGDSSAYELRGKYSL